MHEKTIEMVETHGHASLLEPEQYEISELMYFWLLFLLLNFVSFVCFVVNDFGFKEFLCPIRLRSVKP